MASAQITDLNEYKIMSNRLSLRFIPVFARFLPDLPAIRFSTSLDLTQPF
jgi:hypothetical protein